MDQELSAILGSEQSLGIMEIRSRAAVEVSGIRVEKTLVSRRQFSASAYDHPCFTSEQMMQASMGDSVQSSTEAEREEDKAEREAQGSDDVSGVMIHLNPVELGRWVALRRLSLIGGYEPSPPLGEVQFGQPEGAPLPEEAGAPPPPEEVTE